MKSLFLISILGFFFCGLVACQVATTHESPEDINTESSTLIDPKYSISKDRSELDKLRESVPPQLRQSNDEKALMAEWFADVKYEPEKIRDKFDSLSRKKRDLFSKHMAKRREDFNKEERKKRAEFLKDLEDERKEFNKRKSDREKRNDFFNDQDERRRTFLSDLKDKRENFEGDIREKRKDFDDYIKEKTNDFNTELKAYRLKWAEKNAQH